MIKKYIFILLIAVGSIDLSATTYTSAQNGNWMTPTTWSPVGIPIPGDNAIINHNVVLDTSFAYTTGSITIGGSGSLVQDLPVRDIWLNGSNAVLTNNGTTTIRYLLLSNGTFTNSGDFNVKSVANYITANNTSTGVMMGIDSLYNDGTINNNGTVNVLTFFNNNTINNYGTIKGLATVVDSMFNAGTFLNDIGALLRADSCTNTSQFTNNGVINFLQFTNFGTFTNTNYLSLTDFTNIGTFTNQDSLIGTGSIWNTGDLDNQAGAVIDIGISFLNSDPINFNASLIIDGLFNIGDSYYNYDAVGGSSSGSIILQDTSYNSGNMSGNFDFCDMTPPATAPFIDINLGVVAPSITYCVGVGIVSEAIESDINIYPNPSNGIINIEIDQNIIVEVFNLLGERLFNTERKQLDFSSYKNGIYLLRVKDLEGKLIQHERIVKQ